MFKIKNRADTGDRIILLNIENKFDFIIENLDTELCFNL